jgi:arsenate reductase
MKKKVLFICVHNSARSQMAAAFVNQLCAAQFEAYSAGIEPGKLNPVVVEAMHEIGVDISGNQTWSVSDILKFCKNFAHVVTVCNDADAERCPVLPGAGAQFHWNFPDPSALSGSHSYKLARTREIRDAIKRKVEQWCAVFCPTAASLQHPGLLACCP